MASNPSQPRHHASNTGAAVPGVAEAPGHPVGEPQQRPAQLLGVARALDAIHLATALRLGRSLAAFVSYDARQLEAAEALGLPVASPR